MRNYNNDDRSGGWKPRKSFGSREFGDREKPEMFQTVCSECGNECEVPFKPNGRKPVFCRSCFKKDEFDEGGSDRRDDRRDFGRDSRDSYDKPRFEKPRFEKPRFEKSYEKPTENYKAQFEMLNFKMDMILKALHNMGVNPVAPAKAHEAKKEVKKEEPKKEEVKHEVKHPVSDLPAFIKAAKAVKEPKAKVEVEEAVTEEPVKAKKAKKASKKKA